MNGLRFCSSSSLIFVTMIQTVIWSSHIVYSIGKLRWLHETDFLHGFYGHSIVIDCRLTDPKLNVTFLKRNRDTDRLEEIKPDGKKYWKISNQKMEVRNLKPQDGIEHFCRAAGVSDQTVAFFLKRAPHINDFSVSLAHHESGNGICDRIKDYNQTITCTSDGEATLQLYRKKQGHYELVAANASGARSKGGHWQQTLIYVIHDATKKDNGEYACSLDIVLLKKKIWSISYTVDVVESPPTIGNFKAKQAIEGDKQAVLRCKPDKLIPPEIVTFYVNGVPLERTGLAHRYRTSCQKLRILNPRYPDDNVTIGCKIQNKYGYDMRNATLTVLVKPKFDPDIGAAVGYVVCKVRRAIPAPVITWEMQPYCHRHLADCHPVIKLWRKVPEDRFTIITSNTSYSAKLLLPSSSKDHYFFRCTAKNEAGKDEHIVKYLHIGAREPLTVIPAKKEINERENLQLSCVSQTQSFSDITWIRNGSNLSSNYEISTKKSSSYAVRSILTIKNATLKDSGSFTCVGKKIRGGSETVVAVVTVREIFPPILKLIGKTVIQMETVKLNCDVRANPPAKITWFKDGAKLRKTNLLNSADQCSSSINGHYFEFERGKKILSNLIICKVNFIKNNGTYSCIAENSLGMSKATANLLVLSKPEINLKNSKILVDNKEKVTQKCSAVGNPVPFVYWLFVPTNKRLTSPRPRLSILLINQIHENQFGKYECRASNKLGNAKATLEINPSIVLAAQTASTIRADNESKKTLLYIVSGGVFFVVLCLVCVGFVLLRRKKIYGGFYIFSQPPAPDHFDDIDPARALIEQTNGLPYDPVWEFPRKRVKLFHRLGSGAFGDVHLAEAVGIVCFEPREKISMRQKPLLGKRRSSRSNSTSSRQGSSYRRLATKVAVKKLKENATPEEMRDLISELKILIHIGEHNNIVNMLGACTKGGEKDLMVILEYAPHGNLLTFLKGRRSILGTTWEKQAIGMEDEFTTCDLVVIAYQIAKGMEFLASRRCVHRDLAARNVLVGEGYVMKIADFGLARDIYKDDRYVKLSAGLLPVKWMAIEAVRDRIFTHQSDVWSYGILLWEIMTMGGSPYPGLPVRDLLNSLVSGYRMEQPIYCPPEIYALMRDCWIEVADDRPFFIEIVNRLARIIESHVPPEHCCNYLDQEHINGDGYLRPIESPRSPTDSFMSPPPPYSAYLHQREADNKFFGSDTSLEENSIKKVENKDVVCLGKNRLSSVSEIKAKKDAAQKEKKESASSSLTDIESEDESEACQAAARSSLLSTNIRYDKEKERVALYDSDKDLDEVELQRNGLLRTHSYINEPEKMQDGPYLNA